MVPQLSTPPPPNLNMFGGMVPQVVAAVGRFGLAASAATTGHHVASAQPDTKYV